jgi:hypothetical protein
MHGGKFEWLRVTYFAPGRRGSGGGEGEGEGEGPLSRGSSSGCPPAGPPSPSPAWLLQAWLRCPRGEEIWRAVHYRQHDQPLQSGTLFWLRPNVTLGNIPDVFKVFVVLKASITASGTVVEGRNEARNWEYRSLEFSWWSFSWSFWVRVRVRVRVLNRYHS